MKELQLASQRNIMYTVRRYYRANLANQHLSSPVEDEHVDACLRTLSTFGVVTSTRTLYREVTNLLNQMRETAVYMQTQTKPLPKANDVDVTLSSVSIFVESLLQEKLKSKQKTDEEGNVLIDTAYVAAYENSPSKQTTLKTKLESLLYGGHDPNPIVKNISATPLHYAVANNRLDLIILLCQFGADPFIKAKSNYKFAPGMSALQFAQYRLNEGKLDDNISDDELKKRGDIVNFLKEYADEISTAAMQAASENETFVYEKLSLDRDLTHCVEALTINHAEQNEVDTQRPLPTAVSAPQGVALGVIIHTSNGQQCTLAQTVTKHCLLYPSIQISDQTIPGEMIVDLKTMVPAVPGQYAPDDHDGSRPTSADFAPVLQNTTNHTGDYLTICINLNAGHIQHDFVRLPPQSKLSLIGRNDARCRAFRATEVLNETAYSEEQTDAQQFASLQTEHGILVTVVELRRTNVRKKTSWNDIRAFDNRMPNNNMCITKTEASVSRYAITTEGGAAHDLSKLVSVNCDHEIGQIYVYHVQPIVINLKVLPQQFQGNIDRQVEKSIADATVALLIDRGEEVKLRYRDSDHVARPIMRYKDFTRALAPLCAEHDIKLAESTVFTRVLLSMLGLNGDSVSTSAKPIEHVVTHLKISLPNEKSTALMSALQRQYPAVQTIYRSDLTLLLSYEDILEYLLADWKAGLTKQIQENPRYLTLYQTESDTANPQVTLLTLTRDYETLLAQFGIKKYGNILQKLILGLIDHPKTLNVRDDWGQYVTHEFSLLEAQIAIFFSQGDTSVDALVTAFNQRFPDAMRLVGEESNTFIVAIDLQHLAQDIYAAVKTQLEHYQQHEPEKLANMQVKSYNRHYTHAQALAILEEAHKSFNQHQASQPLAIQILGLVKHFVELPPQQRGKTSSCQMITTNLLREWQQFKAKSLHDMPVLGLAHCTARDALAEAKKSIKPVMHVLEDYGLKPKLKKQSYQSASQYCTDNIKKHVYEVFKQFAICNSEYIVYPRYFPSLLFQAYGVELTEGIEVTLSSKYNTLQIMLTLDKQRITNVAEQEAHLQQTLCDAFSGVSGFNMWDSTSSNGIEFNFKNTDFMSKIESFLCENPTALEHFQQLASVTDNKFFNSNREKLGSISRQLYQEPQTMQLAESIQPLLAATLPAPEDVMQSAKEVHRQWCLFKCDISPHTPNTKTAEAIKAVKSALTNILW